MKVRLLASLIVSMILVFAGTNAIGMAFTLTPPKIIATVVAHAHTPSQEYAANTGLPLPGVRE
jgi:hypothetical protein